MREKYCFYQITFNQNFNILFSRGNAVKKKTLFVPKIVYEYILPFESQSTKTAL
jgi:hypothetical protein